MEWGSTRFESVGDLDTDRQVADFLNWIVLEELSVMKPHKTTRMPTDDQMLREWCRVGSQHFRDLLTCGELEWSDMCKLLTLAIKTEHYTAEITHVVLRHKDPHIREAAIEAMDHLGASASFFQLVYDDVNRTKAERDRAMHYVSQRCIETSLGQR